MRFVAGLLAALATALVAAPAAAQARWRLVEDLRIGTMDEGPASFSDIRGLATNARGWIFVVENSTQDVRVFDERGRHLRTIGRKGSGPGEFQLPNGIARAPGGSLWVHDPLNARLTVLGPDGEVLRGVTETNNGYGFEWGGRFQRDGWLTEPVFLQVENRSQRAIRRWAPDRSRADTLVPPACGGPAAPEPYRISSGTMRGYIAVPFTTGPASVYDLRGGLWCGHTGGYRIARIGLPRGDTLAMVRGEAKPAPLSEAEIEEALRPTLERFKGATFDRSRIPRVRPLVRSLLVDDAGRLWVWRFTAETATVFDVYDAAARPMAVVTGPAGLSPYPTPVIEGNTLYGVVTREDDLPAVVRWRVRAPR